MVCDTVAAGLGVRGVVIFWVWALKEAIAKKITAGSNLVSITKFLIRIIEIA
jgi:hypothetical protein